jgi:copper chaperone CopZ
VLLLSALVIWPAVPAWAQVEKVAMRTTGISCGVCAGLSEIYFRRMPGVDKVSISLSNEAIMLTYKPGAAFDPQAIRKVLQPWEVGVVQFQISARGRIQEQAGKRFFLAGKDKFVVASSAKAPELPSGALVSIEAILDDHPNPMEVKILNFKHLQQ